MNSSLKTSLSYVTRGGVATSAMDTLALGPHLTAYAKLLGAGNIAFGVLNSIPYIGNLMHLVAAWLLTRGFSARTVSIASTLISRPFYFMIALLAFWPTMPGALELLVVFLGCSYLTGCISGGCWLPWMKALVPGRIMGRFFANRFKFMQIAKILCSLAAWRLLKSVEEKCPDYAIYAYAGLFFLSFLIGLYGAYTFVRVEDKPVSIATDMPFARQILLTFKNEPFRLLLLSLSTINFGFAFILPFVTVFALNQMHVPVSSMMLLTLVSQLAYVFVIKKLGKIGDKTGTCSVLVIALLLMMGVLLGLIALNTFRCSGWLLLFWMYVLHIVLGCATAGYNLGLNNASLLYVPNDLATIYLSVNSVFKSAAGAVGSVVAGFVLSLCVRADGVVAEGAGQPIGWNLFFVISILLSATGLLLLKYLRRRHAGVAPSDGGIK